MNFYFLWSSDHFFHLFIFFVFYFVLVGKFFENRLQIGVVNVVGEEREEVEAKGINVDQVLSNLRNPSFFIFVMLLHLPVKHHVGHEIFPDFEGETEDDEQGVEEGKQPNGAKEQVPEPEEHKHLFGHDVGGEDAQEVLGLKYVHMFNPFWA